MSEVLSIPERIEEQMCLLALTIPGVNRVGRWDLRGKQLNQTNLRDADLTADTLLNLDVLVWGAGEDNSDGDSSFDWTHVAWDMTVGVCVMQEETEGRSTVAVARKFQSAILGVYMTNANNFLPEAVTGQYLIHEIRRRSIGTSDIPTGAAGVFAYVTFALQYRHDRTSLNTLSSLITAKTVS